MSQHHFADGGGRVSRASRKSSAAAAVHRSASRRSVAGGGGGSRTRLDARSADPRDDSLNEEDSEDENWAEVNVTSKIDALILVLR